MKAFVLQDGQLQTKKVPNPTVGANEVIVSLRYAGLNRRDLYIKNRHGVQADPLVLGSDGAGVIKAVGSQVSEWQIGDEVIINPSLRWEDNSDAPPAGFDILGMPDDGTMAEEIALDATQIERKPAFLTWEEAGVFALSALTGYRALFTKGRLQFGETVFIPGAGSGVATYMIQFAKAAGARVIVSSRSEEKRQKALAIGADLAIDSQEDFAEALSAETIDLVIDSVGEATFNRSLAVLKQGGTMVVFGATAGDVVQLDLRAFFYGQYQLLGSTMGSREELRSLLTFMEEKHIRPIVGKTFTLDEMEAAFTYLEVNDQFGKIAIKI